MMRKHKWYLDEEDVSEMCMFLLGWSKWCDWIVEAISSECVAR